MAEAKRCLDCAVCSRVLRVRARLRARAPCCTTRSDEELERRGRRRRAGHRLRPPRPRRQERARLPALPQRARRPSSTSACSALRARPSARSCGRPTAQHPQRIAFIQCVGSRDQEHEYCSSVCCMFANKQAMLTIDHVPDAQPDRVPHGHARHGQGLRRLLPARPRPAACSFVRSRPSHDQGGPAQPRTCSSPGKTRPASCTPTSSTWSCSASASSRRARRRRRPAHIGIALNRHGFCQLEEFAPLRDQPRTASSWPAPSASPRTSPTRWPRPRPRRLR